MGRGRVHGVHIAHFFIKENVCEKRIDLNEEM